MFIKLRGLVSLMLKGVYWVWRSGNIWEDNGLGYKLLNLNIFEG